MKPRIVLSGVNFIEAGPLSIFKDALKELSRHFGDRYEIVALVHRRQLFGIDGITYFEFPAIKSSWLSRLRFEYWSCRALSRQLSPILWLSMHDMTPNVSARIRAVYCHNPAPFYHLTPQEALVDWKFSLFTKLYRFLYAVNLKKNNYVIVQQEWMRENFRTVYGVGNIVVAHPSIHPVILDAAMPQVECPHARCTFFYPAFPRSFKNLEAILEAARLLEQREVTGFEIWITVDGKENRYAAHLWEEYGQLRSVRWLGILPRERILALYAEADCLIFPSKLETWGMPISEFQQTGKPMLIADLPYAHETVGAYDAVRFFPPNEPQTLASQLEAFIAGRLDFTPATAAEIPLPFAANWVQLFQILLAD